MTAFSLTVRAYQVGASSWEELPLTLHYQASNPYEVTLSIGDEGVEWRLSRELLQAGTAHPAGEGDVRLWPGRHTPTEQLFMHLSPPSGHALLELPRTAVVEFLGTTECIVPTGTEDAGSFDAELRALLDGDPT